MPRKAHRCVVNLTLNEVSAPGVWLPSREDVYLSVSLFGQYQTTRSLVSVFPLAVYERLRFEKTYYTAVDREEVADYLNDELVIFELVQLSEYTDGAVRLASYSSSVGEILQYFPSQITSEHEILLSRTIAFNGISPKLTFSTRIIIKESLSPELDALEDALEEEKDRRIFLKTHRVPTRRIRSAKTKSASSQNLSVLCYNPSEEDPAPRYQQPTKSSLCHSRSVVLPGSVVDVDLSTSGYLRPAFVVRSVNKDTVRRVPKGGHCDRVASASRKDRNVDASKPKSRKEKRDKKSVTPKASKSRGDLEYSSIGHGSHIYQAYERQPSYYVSDDEDSDGYFTRQRPRSASAYLGYRPRSRYVALPLESSKYAPSKPGQLVPYKGTYTDDLYA